MVMVNVSNLNTVFCGFIWGPAIEWHEDILHL